MQPDVPQYSCCGAGDAYYADRTKECEGGRSDCALIAIITDTRPNTYVLPNGQTINRIPLKVGTEVVIPKHKIRKHPIPNPTDHNIVFINSHKEVLCWEPGSGI